MKKMKLDFSLLISDRRYRIPYSEEENVMISIFYDKMPGNYKISMAVLWYHHKKMRPVSRGASVHDAVRKIMGQR